MVFHPSAFDSVCPKQTLVTTHLVMTTTINPAKNVSVPPQLSFKATNLQAMPSLMVSQIFTTAFHNAETTTTTPANNVYVPPPRLSYRQEFPAL
jgi:hypothetical protein